MFDSNNQDGQASQMPVNEPVGSPAPNVPPMAPTDTNITDELLKIKKEALEHLTPLVSHLEQAPEEKFKTTMMMLQATDDQSLIKAAYEAANGIADEKARAQALLDVVNEINYFTHHQN